MHGKGYGFYWWPYTPPFMVRPDGAIPPHVVEDYLPYLYEPSNYSVDASGKVTFGLLCVPSYGSTPGAGTPAGTPSGSTEESLRKCEEVDKATRPAPKTRSSTL